MTRIHLISDVHLDFGDLNYAPPACDVVILAGDVAEGSYAYPWIERTYGHTPVIYIAGNHEFYSYNMPELYADLARKAEVSNNVTFLQNEVAIINGVRFIGATLWTDFKLGEPLYQEYNMRQAERYMNDYRHITYYKVGNKETIFTPENSLVEHLKSIDFIETILGQPFGGATVVVTHHLPSAKSNMVTKMKELDPAYASDLEHLMGKYKPALWVHGHTHHNKDYMVGDTRVVCNPRGYAKHEYQSKVVDLDLVLEV